MLQAKGVGGAGVGGNVGITGAGVGGLVVVGLAVPGGVVGCGWVERVERIVSC